MFGDRSNQNTNKDKDKKQHAQTQNNSNNDRMHQNMRGTGMDRYARLQSGIRGLTR